MIKVVFVGDSPSALNISPEIPFVGAASFKRLVQWIKYIEPDYYIVLNSSAPQDKAKIIDLYANGFHVVCLGIKAFEQLPPDIGSMVLPHPSGLNRKLNDTKFLDKKLHEAWNYVRDYTPEIVTK